MMRIRYSLPCVLALGFLTVNMAGQMIPSSRAYSDMGHVLANVEPAGGTPISVEKPDDNTKPVQTAVENRASQSKAADNLKVASTSRLPASFYRTIEQIKESEPVQLEMKSGQTVTGQLTDLGISSSEAYKIIEAMSEHYDPRHVKAGQALKVEFDQNKPVTGEFKSLSRMTLPISPAKELVVSRTGQNFKAEEVEKNINTRLAAGRAKLKYSLYGSAAKANIPDAVVAKLIKVYSWNVDFQRDIRSGDEIQILYEVEELDDGTSVGYGDIIYARLVTDGKNIPLYRYEKQDGDIDYYDQDGKSVRSTLMKTPIDGARMSSGFGMRHHPVLGYSKMHKGTDFAAPTGTPIYASGDGVVEHAGRLGSYGNYIRIRHNGELKSAYAHLNKVAVRNGERVEQGEVIGYVGTTGRSTGAHLHYEVLVNGKHTDPRGVNIPTGEQLKGDEFNRFKTQMRKYDQEYAALTKGADYAMAPKTNKARRN